MTKKELARELNISRKTLYNYLNELNIKELDESNIEILRNYANEKNKSKDFSKNELLNKIEELEKLNLQLLEQNKMLQNGNEALNNQIEWFRNSVEIEIKKINSQITLLLNPPKEEKKKSIFNIFRK